MLDAEGAPLPGGLGQGVSHYWMAGRRAPPPNADAIRLAPAFAYLPNTFGDIRWSQQERMQLQSALLRLVQARQLPQNRGILR